MSDGIPQGIALVQMNLNSQSSPDLWEVLFLFAACSVKLMLILFQKTEPSVCLKYNTINILLAYTYMVMRYNGEHHDMCVQCAEDFVSLSQVLLTAENCKSTSEAIRCFCASLKKVPIKPSPSAVPSVFSTQILCGMEYFTVHTNCWCFGL